MGKNLEEKSLMTINEKSIFYRIKRFFRNLFKGNVAEVQSATANITSDKQINKTTKETFVETLKNVENEETRLLKLQKQYEKGEIASSELSNEQVLSLKKLYKKQISDLEKSNQNRKRKILQHKDGKSFFENLRDTEIEETNLLKLQRQYDNGSLKIEDLSNTQVEDLVRLYKKQISQLNKSNEARKQKLLQYRNRLQAT